MKNRILPFSLFIVAIGLTFFLFSSTFLHQHETSSPKDASYTNGGKVFKPAAKYLAKIRNNQVTGQIDFRDVVQARNQLERMSASSNRNFALDWKLLGPDNFSGRTRALIFDSGDETSNTIIAASVSGGLYKSTNLGLTWNKINGWDKALKVSCMVQDDQGNIYAGTGESFATEDFTNFGPLGYNGGFIGTGIYMSTDGNTFNQLEDTKPVMNSDTAAWAFINDLAYNSTNGHLLASTNHGLRVSVNGGTTWTIAKTTEGESLTGNSFDVNVGSDGKIIADIDNLCYISASGNPVQFVLSSRGDSASLPTSDIGRIEFAIAPSDPNVVYASVTNEEGALVNIYLSDDGGNDWRIIAPGGTESLNFFGHGDNVDVGQGIYNNCLEVFPDDPYKVILGGINLWEGRKYTETGFYQWTQRSSTFAIPGFISGLHEDQHSIVFRPGHNNQFAITNDGGVFTGIVNNPVWDFTNASKTYYSTQYYTCGPSGKKFKIIGGTQDNGVLMIDGYGPGATAKNASVLPLYDYDGGYSFISSIDEFAYIVSGFDGTETTIRRTDDGALSYSNSFLSGDISIPEDAFMLPSLLWENFDNENSRDSIYFFSREFAFNAGDAVPLFSQNLGYPFYHTLTNALGPNDSVLVKDVVATKFFIAYLDEVWMTTQALDYTALPPEWFLISDESVGFEGHPQSIAVSKDANYAWVGTQEGRLFRIANIALAYDYDRADVNSPFCQISTTEVPVYEPGTSTQITQAITSISVDQNDPDLVMITLGNYGNNAYVMKSSNGLAQIPDFTSAQGNLPQMPVYASIIEMNNSNMAIIGTEHGTFITQNLWASSPEWTQATDENQEAIGQTPVFMIKQQTIAQPSVPIWEWDGIDSTQVWYPGTDNFGVIYAGTHGRGLFMNDQYQKPVGIHDPLPTLTSASNLLIYPNPVTDNAYLDIELKEASNVQIFVFDINGRMVSTDDLSHQPAGLLHYQLNCNELPSGTYVVRLVAGKTMETTKFIVNK